MDLTGFSAALYVSSMRGGGAERVMLQIAAWMADRGAHVDLVLLQKEGPYLSRVPEAVRIVDLAARRAMTGIPGLVAYLRRERPAALLSTLIINNVIAAWAGRASGGSSRIVLREGTALSEVIRRQHSRLERHAGHLARLSYPLADAIVGVSDGVSRDIARVVPAVAERTHTIYNPAVSEELLHRAVSHPRRTRASTPNILACGRLVAEKGFETLLRAFARIRRQLTARLIILGEGEQRGALESLSRELRVSRDVDFPGWVQDPFGYMLEADVFVLSSMWEGLPNVLIEALAAGCPVVSTDCPHGPAEILMDGRYGTLVPVGDVHALATGIMAELETPRRVEHQRSRAKDFSVERVMPQYVAVLTGVDGEVEAGTDRRHARRNGIDAGVSTTQSARPTP
jgi:glycosyltransferase involved in cell wall biosynthesis